MELRSSRSTPVVGNIKRRSARGRRAPFAGALVDFNVLEGMDHLTLASVLDGEKDEKT